jgi:Golgi nucleoside diphosphatase
VYSWLDHEVAKQQRLVKGQGVAVLPRVEKGVEVGDGWTMKVEPGKDALKTKKCIKHTDIIDLGISTFGTHPEDVDTYLAPLFNHAKSIIPPSQLASTPVYLLATAGMRLIPEHQSKEVLAKACRYIKDKTPFRVHSCEDDVRIISGEEEGVYGWVAINYLMDGFDAHGVADKGKGKHSSTYGFLDMGGASTQIAFEPSTEARSEHADNLLSVNLRLLDGEDVHHPVFVTTWLGYGTNQARERYIDASIAQHLKEHPPDPGQSAAIGTEKAITVVSDPCLPKSLTLTESRHPGYLLQGTGSFPECLKRSAPLLNKELPCPDEPCLMGVHVPPIDFSVNHFIGISEYWYSTQELWSMGGVYDFPTFQKNAMEYCSQDWNDIQKEYAPGSSKYAAGHRAPDVHRLEMQCFKAAWIVNVLHDGIGIPRLAVDKGGDGGKGNSTEDALQKAEQKGFAEAPPNFQSVDEINNVAVSWTLGRMVLEVTDSVPHTTSSEHHEHEIDSKTPAFEWKAPHHNSWRYRLQSGLQRTTEQVHPLAAFAVVLVGLLIYFLMCRGQRKSSWLGSSGKPRREDYGLVAMEEGGRDGTETPEGDQSHSPRKQSNVFSRTLMPFRILASRATAVMQKDAASSASAPFIPFARSHTNTPHRSPNATSIALPPARPTSNLRHAASSPALFRGSPPQRTHTFPTSSSVGRLHFDVTSDMSFDGNDNVPPPLTPPVRAGSPAWSLRMTSSPKGGTNTARHNSQAHRSATSDSEGYLSIPVGVSSTSASKGEALGMSNINSSATSDPEESAPGLRSRNSSYTNLHALARLRGGHARQASTDAG